MLGSPIFQILRRQWQRDRLLLSRQQGTWLNPLIFFALIATMFPLTLQVQEELLQQLGPGVIWVGAMLAMYMTLESLLASDYEDGTIISWRMQPVPLSLLILVRLASNWVYCGLPLAGLAAVLGQMYHLSLATTLALVVGLGLGTWVMAGIGAIGLALTLASRSGGVLLAVIILPLYVPVLIIGSMLASCAQQGLLFAGTGIGLFALLSAMAVLVLCFVPLVIALVLVELVE